MRLFLLHTLLFALLSLSSCKKDHKVTKSITFNPDHNQSEVHLFGNNTGIDQSGLDVSEIEGGVGTYLGDTVFVRADFTFDLSDIPSFASVVSAKLFLYSNPTPLNGEGDKSRANSGKDNAILISRIASSWIPSSITWLNQPPTTESDQIVIPHTDSAFLDLEDINVTKMVTTMVKADQNYGFQIRLKTEKAYTWRIFCSSKYPNTSKHPKLVVQYTE